MVVLKQEKENLIDLFIYFSEYSLVKWTPKCGVPLIIGVFVGFGRTKAHLFFFIYTFIFWCLIVRGRTLSWPVFTAKEPEKYFPKACY